MPEIPLADKQAQNIIKEKLESVMSVIPKTYTELAALKSSGKLVPGQLYTITDYATKYRQPVSNVIITMEIEPLTVYAVSETQFAEIAYSMKYPQDIIYYHFDNNYCEDYGEKRNGFIQRRIDTVKKIDAPNDWRTMVWARYKANGKAWAGESVLRRTVYEYNEDLYITTKSGTPQSSTDEGYFLPLGYTVNDYIWSYAILPGMTLNGYAQRYTFNLSDNLTKTEATPFGTSSPECIKIESDDSRNDGVYNYGLHNNVWQYPEVFRAPRNVMLANGCHSNTFGGDCHSNTFGAGCHSNIFGRQCYSNTFGSGFSTNILGISSSRNTLGSDCLNNILGDNFTVNNAGSSFNGNISDSGCRCNTFGTAFSDNTIGKTFIYNCIGNICESNTFGLNFTANDIEADCYNNTFGQYFKYNRVRSRISGKDFSSIAELHNKSYNHTIFKNSSNGVMATWHNSSNAQQFLPL